MSQTPSAGPSDLELHLRGANLERLGVAKLSITLPVTQTTLSEAWAIEWARAAAERRGLVHAGEPRAYRVRTPMVLGGLRTWTWRVVWGEPQDGDPGS